jgi:hypothetical protein
MRRTMMIAILGLLGMGFVGCGGSDPTEQDTCKQAVGIACQRLNSCLGATFSLLYSSVADCTTKMEADYSCATKTCTAPQKFVPANGRACINAITTVTCTELEAGQPAACADSLMCQ